MKQKAMTDNSRDSSDEGNTMEMKKAGLVIRKFVLKPGAQLADPPRDGALCTVDIIKVQGDRTAEDSQSMSKIQRVTFTLGEGSEHGIPPQVEHALRRFRSGERSRIEIARSKIKLYPDQPVGVVEGQKNEEGKGCNVESGVVEGKHDDAINDNDDYYDDEKVLPKKEDEGKQCGQEKSIAGNNEKGAEGEGVGMEYIVELISFKQMPGHWEVSGEESLTYAVALKNRGTEFFKAEKYGLSKKYYKKAILFLQRSQLDQKRPSLMSPSSPVTTCEATDETTSIEKQPLQATMPETTTITAVLESDPVATTETTKKQPIQSTMQQASSKTINSYETGNGTTVPSVKTSNGNNETSLGSENQSKTECEFETMHDLIKNIDTRDVNRVEQMLACYLNLSLCYLTLGKNISALESCDKALQIDSKNEKGLYRRGLVHMAVDDLELAIDDFSAVLAIQPNNKAAAQQLSKAKAKLSEYSSRQKLIYTGMFNRFAEQDIRRQRASELGGLDVFSRIGEWNNDLASGMMTLEQEMAAFGEKMPEPRYNASRMGLDDENKENEPDSDYD